jgi:hypothetical protein
MLSPPILVLREIKVGIFPKDHNCREVYFAMTEALLD